MLIQSFTDLNQLCLMLLSITDEMCHISFGLADFRLMALLTWITFIDFTFESRYALCLYTDLRIGQYLIRI